MKTNKLLMLLAFLCLLLSFNAQSAAKKHYSQPLFMLSRVHNASAKLVLHPVKKGLAFDTTYVEPIQLELPWDGAIYWHITYDSGAASYSFDIDQSNADSGYLGDIPEGSYVVTISTSSNYYNWYWFECDWYGSDLRYHEQLYSYNPYLSNYLVIYNVYVTHDGELNGQGNANYLHITR